jgi:enoyl-CoA hydratase
MFHFDVRGHLAIMTIDRPEARNAINTEVARALDASIERIENDDDLWVGILTGVPPVFCAGADLKELRSKQAGGIMSDTGAGFGGLTGRERRKPLIAAVDGAALAGGAEFVLACDLVVASTRASFGLPEVKRCLVAGAGGLFRLGRRIPLNVAMECALTGDPISAERAHEFGFVNELVPAGEALDRAIALAERICANAPTAVIESRRIVLEATGQPDAVGFEMSLAALNRLMRSEDYREGLDAFIEKRPPVWKGR